MSIALRTEDKILRIERRVATLPPEVRASEFRRRTAQMLAESTDARTTTVKGRRRQGVQDRDRTPRYTGPGARAIRQQFPKRMLEVRARKRPAREITGPVPRNPRPFTNDDVARFLQSGQYNVAFALGHQRGPVPIPLFSPGKAPFSYMACSGTVNVTLNVNSGTSAIMIVTPYAQYPLSVFTNINSFDPILATADVGDYADKNGWPSRFTPVGTPWVGSTDPRTLVSGQLGPINNDMGLTPGNKLPMLQQFMGGRLDVSTSATITTNGTVSIIDSKSYPTMYGAKLPPYNTSVTTSAIPGFAPGDYTQPDQEDMLRYYTPMFLVDVAISTLASSVRTTQLVGASNQSTVHCPFLIPPDGQMWVPWSGYRNQATPDIENGNSLIGGVPYQNILAAISMGYPTYIVVNNGSTSMSINVAGEFFYNCQIPTTGLNSIPVLAAHAPVSKPHTSSVAQIHSVPVLHHDHTQAHDQHRSETAVATTAAGLNTKSVDVKGVEPIHPAPAQAKPSAGKVVGNAVDKVLETAGHVVLGGLSTLADKAVSGIGDLLSSIF